MKRNTKKLNFSSKKKIKIVIFISDVGFGHMARERAIIYEIFKTIKKAEVTIVNSSVIELVKQEFKKKCKYIVLNNNIILSKTKWGILSLPQTKKNFEKWKKNYNNNLIKLEKILKDFDLIISDFVPEAFELGERLNIPSYGICHYTWSWFMKAIGINKELVLKTKTMESKARNLFFPPFVPHGSVTSVKKDKIINVSFIVNQNINKNLKKKSAKKIILLMDSGTKLLSLQISKTLKEISKIDKYIFYIGTSSLNKEDVRFISKQKNMVPITGIKQMYREINNVDYVIARAGFNTLSECIMYKKPTLFIDEFNNPEINENIRHIKKIKLGALFSARDWGKNFNQRLNRFVRKEKNDILKNINNFQFNSDGEKQIIKYIKKDLKI